MNAKISLTPWIFELLLVWTKENQLIFQDRKSHQNCSVKTLFGKITHNLQENSYIWVILLFSLVFSSEFCGIFQNIFSILQNNCEQLLLSRYFFSKCLPWISAFFWSIQLSILLSLEFRSRNPFYATSLFLYPLKTSANLWFSEFTEGIEGDQWHEMG